MKPYFYTKVFGYSDDVLLSPTPSASMLILRGIKKYEDV